MELCQRHIRVNNPSIRFEDPKKLLAFLRTSRLKKPSLSLELGAYFKTIRTDHRLARQDVAVAVNLSNDDLKKIESPKSLLWDLPPDLIAQLACLYHIEMRHLEKLAQNSCRIATFTGRVTDPDSASTATSHWISQVRTSLEQFGAKELLAVS